MLLRTKHQIIARASALADLLALLVSFLGAAEFAGMVESGYSLSETLTTRYTIANDLVVVVLAGLWLMAYQGMNLYQPESRIRDWLAEAAAIGKASAIGCIIFAAAGLFFHIRLLTPLFFSVFLPCVTFVDLVLRRITRYSLRSVNLGDRNQRKVLIIGTNDAALSYAEMVRENKEIGYRLIGFLDDEIFDKKSKASPYIGKLSDFPALLEKTIVDEIVIIMPVHSSRDEINKVIDLAYVMGISVRFPADQLFKEIVRYKKYRIRAETMPASHGAIGIDVVIFSGHQLTLSFITKRLLDVVITALMVIVASPLMLVIALLILLNSGQPVLFIQKRYGYNRRVFNLYKFRTMIQGADALQEDLRSQNERTGPAFKLQNDPRVTAVGRWLRKTNLDELPQLFNILKGDMSLVGPRPVSLDDYARIDGNSQRRRLSVLPGLTGTWQIAPGRENISFEEWMLMDLEYIDNWKLGTDLAILAKTIPVVLLGRGDR